MFSLDLLTLVYVAKDVIERLHPGLNSLEEIHTPEHGLLLFLASQCCDLQLHNV